VLNHTDLSRDSGTSGEIDLAHVNWGNYDLVVIDESHNFRNKGPQSRGRDALRPADARIIKEGVKTRVLMLSATPVNNRLADLKNQIAFATEGNDAGWSITASPASRPPSAWPSSSSTAGSLPEPERRPAALMDMLGFDYFKLLDLLTIARSRKHIEKYYGTPRQGASPSA
jgi:hypothetical protein